MPLSVLVVDDSNFFQQRLTEIINSNPKLKVVGIASNGQEAVDKAASLKPDVITMDFEMPVLDGVSAVRQIMANNPTPILMFSSLTYEGARITLDALEAGAVDFISKDFGEVSRKSSALVKKLHDTLLHISKKSGKKEPIESPSKLKPAAIANPVVSKQPPKPATPTLKSVSLEKTPSSRPVKPAAHKSLRGRIKLLGIGSSTGGPVALMEVLKKLPANFPLALVIIQHMPENFTKAFAERLNRQCQIQIREAVDGDRLAPGLALLAPGGKQMMVDKNKQVRILPGDERVNYKPSVDITLGSAANVFGDATLAVILTGMGADGTEGCKLIKQKGGYVWSQDKETSTIYGMPMAVARAGVTDRVLPLEQIGTELAEEF